MLQSSSVSTKPKPAFEFKSSTFNVPALILSSYEIADIQQQLQAKISQAPDFFKNSPLLIDCHDLSRQPGELDLRSLVKMLQSLHFIPIAISGAPNKQNELAIELGLAVQSTHNVSEFKNHLPEPDSLTTSMVNPEFVTKTPMPKNKMITVPVRSGQRIYAKGDLTVLAPVSSGAELMAEGNIHVYAPMRGRALAGVQGNTSSCIFCSDLQADLISIAGIYRLSEDIEETFKHTLVQIYLNDQALLIKKL